MLTMQPYNTILVSLRKYGSQLQAVCVYLIEDATLVVFVILHTRFKSVTDPGAKKG